MPTLASRMAQALRGKGVRDEVRERRRRFTGLHVVRLP